MGLKHITFATSVVEFPGGDITVRGLNLDDIIILIQLHRGPLDVLFNSIVDKAKKAKGEPGSEFEVEELGLQLLPLISQAPVVAAQIIACAADEPGPDGLKIAKKLPLPVQVDALEKILALTFQTIGGPKKLLETVVRLAQGANGLLSDLNQVPQA